LNPTTALTNAISFHHIADGNRFGNIRLWGTIGWIAAAWVYGLLTTGNYLFLSQNLKSALQLSIYGSVILAFYALTLPKGVITPKSKINLFPIDSFRILLKPEILFLTVTSAIVMMIDRFYIFGGAPFLKDLHYSEKDILPILSIGQIPEILFLFALSFILRKFGFTLTILCGLILEIIRFAIFAFTSSEYFLLTGIAIHGTTWALFFIPITIYIDKKCSKYTRAGVQQFYTLFSAIGVMGGNLISGLVADSFKTSTNEINYTMFWSIPLICSVVVTFLFIILFNKEKQTNFS
jgi:hypothetical protein